MDRVTQVLRGVEVEFGDPAQDVIWLRYGDDDMHYCLPPEAPVTIGEEVRARSYVLYWLMVNRGTNVAVDLTVDRDRDGLERIEAAVFRPL
jgi:hypothetical protein